MKSISIAFPLESTMAIIVIFYNYHRARYIRMWG